MFENYKDVLTVQETCAALHIGKNSLYRLLKMGAIRSIKVGRKYLIPKIYLLDFISKYRYNNTESNGSVSVRKEST